MVHRRPRVAIISSGDELVSLGDFEPGHIGSRIVSSNSVTLVAAVSDAGAEAIDLGIARDNPQSIREKLEAARTADLIVTTAGISVGDHDHVRTVFTDMGGTIDFWKVRMRPGAPAAFGSLGGVPWLGLSGNPVSAIVTFELFVRPAIRRMLGFTDIFRATVPVRLRDPVTLAASLMHFLRVVIHPDQSGTLEAELAGSQSSAVLTALARANALLILPGDRLELQRGEMHRALPLGEGFGVSPELRLT
jgi:molybdopterin molybdotransferase